MQAIAKEISPPHRTTSQEGPIEIMTAKEVASFLKISVKTVYSYASRRMMPIYWKFQNNVRFEKQQILDWMRQNNQAVPTKAPRRVA